MSWITRIFLLWLLAWVLFTPYRSHAQATNAAISDLERPIHACEQQVASWTHEEKVEKFFVIVAFICGVVIASVQGSKKTWAKALAVSLGLVVAILTGVNSRAFTADDRTLGRAAFKGSTVINQLWVLVDTLKDERVSPQDKVIAKGEYLKKLLEFQAIGERLNGTA